MAAVRPSYLLGRVHRLLRAKLEAGLAEFDLTVAEITALSVLDRRPGLSNAHLARQVLVSPQAMHKVMTSLEQKGHVDRTAAAGGTMEAVLTDRGRSQLRKAEAALAGVEGEFFGTLDEDDRLRLIALLARLGSIDASDC